MRMKRSVSKHVSFFYVYALPFPRISATDPRVHPLAGRAARLVCTAPEFDDLAKSVGLNPADHRAGITDPAERAKLRALRDGAELASKRLFDAGGATAPRRSHR